MSNDVRVTDVMGFLSDVHAGTAQSGDDGDILDRTQTEHETSNMHAVTANPVSRAHTDTAAEVADVNITDGDRMTTRCQSCSSSLMLYVPCRQPAADGASPMSTFHPLEPFDHVVQVGLRREHIDGAESDVHIVKRSSNQPPTDRPVGWAGQPIDSRRLGCRRQNEL